MFRSDAHVATEKASKYIAQLCKHFAHKIAVEYDAAQGRADFPFGVCRMEASEQALLLRCEAPDAAALERVEGVVAIHLEKFAWREKPEIAWTAPTGTHGRAGPA